jgi:methylated-DNA-[protein]-cysteine S-methyltransferase
MTVIVDIIFAEPINCYIEIRYDNNELSGIRFIKTDQNLTEKKTRKASFQLDEYFRGIRKEFSCEYDISKLSVFGRRVLSETVRIGYGKTITYSQLAGNIGTKSARAVGRALANNPIPLIIPCHRVIAKNGIGGYSGGVGIKTRLLELEKPETR